MADANTSSTQQASDAQHVDNMTSMQQSTPDAPSGARSDAPVQTNNVGSQDGPSQLNSNPNGNSASNNNLGGGLQNSVINGASSGNFGRGAGLGGGDAGGALNGLAGNGGNTGGAQGQGQGQGGAGNTGGNNLGGNNGGAAGSAGIVTAGARSLAAFGGAGAGNAANVGAANGAPTGGGEGGVSPPTASTNPPSNGTNTTIPVTTTTTAGPTFTPVGADDASNSSGQPQVHLGNTGNLIEAGGVNNAIAGTPSISDTLISSTGSTFTVVTNATASTSGYGTYTMDADGTWHYTLNNSNITVQALNVGGSLTDTFTVSTIDGTQQVVTVTIAGANDIPVIGAATTNLGLGLYDTDIAHSYTNPYPDIAGTGALTHANFLADGVISITDVDLGQSTFQTGDSSSLGASTVVSATGNIGTLVLAVDGSYTYRIDQLPTNASGQFDPLGSVRDDWVLTDFQTLFVPGTTHTDTFTITSFDGTTKDVHFTINGDHNIEGSVVEPDPTTPAIKTTGSLNFAAGTHDAMVLVGNDINAYYSGISHLNIGSLSIDNTGAFVYTVTADAIKTYEGDLPGSFNTGRDTFIVESTNGVNVNYQEVSFNIFRADHLATATGADQTLTEASIAGDNVFLFPTWDSVYNATHNYLHTIDNFNVMNGDRIDLSAILTSSSDTLSDTIFIDGAGGASSSALSVHHGGSDYQVASITGVEATVNDLMWGFNSGADPVTSLNAATTWTDVIDISNISLGNPTITAHSGASVDQTAYTAGAGGWTIDIVSGNATVSADKDGTQHINFTSPNSQNEVIITDPSKTVHDLSNINQINWHAT